MEWKIEDLGAAVLVDLCSNPVNKQNPEFLRDLHTAFDRLDKEHPGKPAVLTSQGKIFSAGLDLDHVFPMFARADYDEVQAWFTGYRAAMVRVLTSPRMVIAALNGPAFAGGMVLALCCDFRLAAQGDSKYGLNEVVIGVPMPSVYTEITRFRIGARSTAEAVLQGKIYGVEDAHRIGLVDETVPAGELTARALKLAASVPGDCWSTYAQTKRSHQYPVLSTIRTISEALDQETFHVLISPECLRAQARALEKLKTRR